MRKPTNSSEGTLKSHSHSSAQHLSTKSTDSRPQLIRAPSAPALTQPRVTASFEPHFTPQTAYQRVQSMPLPLSSSGNTIGPGHRDAIESWYKQEPLPRTLEQLHLRNADIRKRFIAFLKEEPIDWTAERKQQLYQVCDHFHAQARERVADLGKQLIRMSDAKSSVSIMPKAQVEAIEAARGWAARCLDRLLGASDIRASGMIYAQLLKEVRSSRNRQDQPKLKQVLDSSEKLARIRCEALVRLRKTQNERELYDLDWKVQNQTESICALQTRSEVFRSKWQQAWSATMQPYCLSLSKIRDRRLEALIQKHARIFATSSSMQSLLQAYDQSYLESWQLTLDFPMAFQPDFCPLYERAVKRLGQSQLAKDAANAPARSRKQYDNWQKQCQARWPFVHNVGDLQFVSSTNKATLSDLGRRFPSQTWLIERGSKWLESERRRIASSITLTPAFAFEGERNPSTCGKGRSSSVLATAHERSRVVVEAAFTSLDVHKAGLHKINSNEPRAEERYVPYGQTDIGAVEGPPDSGERGRTMSRVSHFYDNKWSAPSYA